MKKFGLIVGLGIVMPFIAGAYGSLISPVINSLTPNSGSAGTVVVINGSGLRACLSCESPDRQLVVKFGTSATVTVIPDSDSLATFTIPASLVPICPSGGCSALELSGDYSISVINQNGITSNPVTLTVTGAPPAYAYPTPYATPYSTPYEYPTPATVPVVQTQTTQVAPVYPTPAETKTAEVKTTETKSTEVKTTKSKSSPEAPDATSTPTSAYKYVEGAAQRLQARLVQQVKGFFRLLKGKISGEN